MTPMAPTASIGRLTETGTMNPEQTLAHWRAEESEVRERLAERAGYVPAQQLDGRSGIHTLQAIFAGELPSPPMGDTLGFVPIRIEHGLAVFQGKPASRMASLRKFVRYRWAPVPGVLVPVGHHQ